MSPTRLFFGIIALAGALLIGLWLGAVVLGPTAAPRVDPLVTWNQRSGAASPNAADFYEQAHAAIAGSLLAELFAGSRDDLNDLRAGELVQDNAALLAALERAATASECHIVWERDASGDVIAPNWINTIAEVMRASCYGELMEQDLSGLAEATGQLVTFRRHMRQQPVIDYRWESWTCTSVLWTARYGVQVAAAGGDRLQFIEAVDRLASEMPDVAVDLERYEEEFLFQLSARAGNPIGRFFASRTLGEIRNRIREYRTLAALPVEQWADPDTPLRARLLAAEQSTASGSTKPFARVLLNPMGAARNLVMLLHVFQSRAADIARLRAARTLLALHRFRIEHGDWPIELGELGDHDFLIEPFTARPFIYQRDGDGFRLYGAGPDRDDDGGLRNAKLIWPDCDPPPDGDFLIWPEAEP